MHERRRSGSRDDVLALLLGQVEAMGRKLDDMAARQVAMEAQIATLMAANGELQALVTGKRWAVLTVRVLAWVGGAIVSALVFISELWPLIGRGEWHK